MEVCKLTENMRLLQPELNDTEKARIGEFSLLMHVNQQTVHGLKSLKSF